MPASAILSGRQVEHAGGERLGDDREVGVLEEQTVVAQRRAVGLAQETVPELALEGHLRVVAEGGPERLQVGPGAAEGEALAAEFALDRERLRRQVVPVGERGLQPGEQRLGVLGPDLVAADLGEGPVAQLERDEERAVGGDAEVAAAGLALALAQVARELGQHVAHLLAEV
jgi:hypothetical protein